MNILDLYLNLLLKKNLIINLLLEIIFVGISLAIFQKIFKTKFSKKHTCIYILINTICFIISNFLENYIYSYILTFVSSSVYFIYLLKVSKLKIFSYFSLKSIILLNIQLCIFKPLCIISGCNSYSEIIELPIFQIFSIILFTIIGLIIYSYSKHLKFDNLLVTSINEKSNLIITISLLNLAIVYSIFYNFFEILIQNLLYILILDIYFYFSINNIIHLCNRLYAKQKIANLKLCNKTILTMYDDTRAFKHDFHNIIQAIGGYIWTNDIEGLKKYYNEITVDCKNVNNLSKLNPQLINNPAIYNILADKYHIANNNNIQINLDIMLDLNELNIKIYELTRILGILLDNAIEASNECIEKNINIFFKQDNYKQMLIIENTYNDKHVSIEKIFEKDYSTKPNNTGLGLWEVRKILSRNSNLNLHTSKDKDYFSQQLEIYTA